jgi:mutator protein MutT
VCTPEINHMPPLITVAAAVIKREGRLLLGQRPRGKRHGGLWEFPGGKLLLGETVTEAIGRELREELDVELDRVGPVLFRARDPGAAFNVWFVEVAVCGTPRALEHTALKWCDRPRLLELDLAPADRQFAAEDMAVWGHRVIT